MKKDSLWKLPENGGASFPRYKKIIQLVESYLAEGLLTGGQRLPPERELAALLGVNRTTVIRALDELAERGVLVRKRGSGTYVNPDKWGVQSRVVFTWRPFPRGGGLRDDEKDGYEARAEQAGAARRASGISLMDLSSDHLPADLLPTLSLPEFSWRELISAEQVTGGETERNAGGEEAAEAPLRTGKDASPGAADVREEGGRRLAALADGAAEGAHDVHSSMLGYGPLRLAVQRFMRTFHGVDVPYGQILITSGTQQAIFLTTQCLLRPGDAVGVEFPSYFYSLPVFQATGLRLCALPMDEEGITLDGLDRQFLAKRLKMVFLNAIFHNPTGTVMSPDRKREVLEYCATRRIPVFEDDAYSLLAFDPGLDTSPMKRLDAGNGVIYSGSLSSYAGHGLRTGWLVAPEPVVTTLAETRRHMDSGLSVLPQVLARHYLEHDFPTHRLALWENLAQRADSLCRFLRERYGDALRFNAPKGGLYLYAALADAVDEPSFLSRLLDDGVLVARARRFGGPDGAFRCNFAKFV